MPRLRISDCGLKTNPRRNACPAARRLELARADCAKRTQFAVRRAWPWPEQIVRNEANFTRRPGNGRGRPGPRGPTEQKMQNEPNLPPRTGRQGRGWSESCETNPIRRAKCAKRTQFGQPPSIRGTKRAKRTQSGGVKCAKRGQFPSASSGTEPRGRGTRGKRAKRTQFAARRVARASCPWIGTMGKMGTPNAIYRVWEPMPMPLYRLTAELRTRRRSRVNRAKQSQFSAGHTLWRQSTVGV